MSQTDQPTRTANADNASSGEDAAMPRTIDFGDSADQPRDGMPEPYDRATDASTAAVHGKPRSPDDIARDELAERDRDEPGLKDRRRQAIKEFIREFAPHDESQDLLAQMVETVCRLSADGTDRLGLKMLASAMKELRHAFRIFKPYEAVRKCTIFGSARTPEEHPAYRATVDFAKRISEQNWMVITGAGDGIMKAGHEGAGTANSFGVSIRLPFETNANTFINGDPKLVNFRYFFTRKVTFLKEADAVVLAPGGFGTHDELFETLTLVQTGKSQPMPIVLLDEPGGRYWHDWVDYAKKHLLGNMLISEEDLALFRVTDDIDEAVEDVAGFYRRYHSSRYVSGNLIIRLQRPLPDGRLHELNTEFANILTTGKITELTEPLPDEAHEEPHLPRLKLAFNKTNHGRLRMLIDAINRP